jgi:hypothetical protein
LRFTGRERGFFERRGREGYAENAENAEKKYKKNTKLNSKKEIEN